VRAMPVEACIRAQRPCAFSPSSLGTRVSSPPYYSCLQARRRSIFVPNKGKRVSEGGEKRCWCLRLFCYVGEGGGWFSGLGRSHGLGVERLLHIKTGRRGCPGMTHAD
jgi:hypothetical protein